MKRKKAKLKVAYKKEMPDEKPEKEEDEADDIVELLHEELEDIVRLLDEEFAKSSPLPERPSDNP